MNRTCSGVGRAAALALALAVGRDVSGAAAQATVLSESPAPAHTVHKSVYGKLESVDKPRNAVLMRSEANERLAWRFKAKVIAEIARFNPGDPMIVIYRQTRPNEKVVTAVAFPGAAETPIYVNVTGSRIALRSGPATDGVCSENAGPVNESTVPIDGLAEISDACWCCAPAGDSCAPTTKSGLGRAILVQCFK